MPRWDYSLTIEDRLLDRIWFIPGGCWQKLTGLTKKGYPQININGKIFRAHRIAYELWVGSIEPGLFVCHSCDNRACIRPEHLFLGTAQDNTDDMIRKNRVQGKPCPHGVRTWNCKPCIKIYNRNYYLKKKAG